MTRHYMHYAESDLGEGTVYFEFVEDRPTRQIEVYGNVWRWGDAANNRWLADQAFPAFGLKEEHKISAEQFERIWEQAVRECPRPL